MNEPVARRENTFENLAGTGQGAGTGAARPEASPGDASPPAVAASAHPGYPTVMIVRGVGYAAIIALCMAGVVVLLRLPAMFTVAAPGAKASLTSPSFELTKILLDKGVLALLVFAVGALVARRVDDRKRLQAQADKLADEQRSLAKSRADDEFTRRKVPRTQLDVDCRFYGPVGGKIIADIRVIAENKGQTIRLFHGMNVRVFALLEGDEPELYRSKDGMQRLALRGDRVDAATDNYDFSIEPGIRQVFPLTTLIDERSIYVSVKVDVWTGGGEDPGSTWLGEERFFPVRLELAPSRIERAALS